MVLSILSLKLFVVLSVQLRVVVYAKQLQAVRDAPINTDCWMISHVSLTARYRTVRDAPLKQLVSNVLVDTQRVLIRLVAKENANF